MEKVTLNNQAALARQGELVVQELPDEVLVYDLKRHKAHCLNKTAAFVWQHCDGQTSVAEMTSLLRQEAGGEPVDEEVVWYALDKLGKASLLEGELNLPVKDTMSRRRMIRRLGALAVIPAVTSLVAPLAAQGSTVLILGKKIAVGQCNQQDNPVGCSDDTCCTGVGGGDDTRACIQVGASTFPGQVDTQCLGPLCDPASNAAPCS